MTPFQVYSNTLPVKGYARSSIYNLHKNIYLFVPNSFSSYIIQNNFSLNLHDLNDEYKHFLISNGLGYKKEKKDVLPPFFNLDYNTPSIIEILILNTIDFLKKKMSVIVINELNIKAIQLRCSLKDTSLIPDLLIKILETTIEYFEVLIDAANSDINEINQLIDELKHFPLLRINIYNVQNNDIEKINKNNTQNLFVMEVNYSKIFRNLDSFSVNKKLFVESQKHHTYFNRKLYIGKNGEIKNAPECKEELGNIQDVKGIEELKSIISQPKFQKYWFVNKEICDVCKDCEFRHMCVDNRLPYQREDKEWYHKTECDYNPYICKWEGEEGYQTLKECGVISDESGFSINHEKIAKLNKLLWEEGTENA